MSRKSEPSPNFESLSKESLSSSPSPQFETEEVFRDVGLSFKAVSLNSVGSVLPQSMPHSHAFGSFDPSAVVSPTIQKGKFSLQQHQQPVFKQIAKSWGGDEDYECSQTCHRTSETVSVGGGWGDCKVWGVEGVECGLVEKEGTEISHILSFVSLDKTLNRVKTALTNSKVTFDFLSHKSKFKCCTLGRNCNYTEFVVQVFLRPKKWRTVDVGYVVEVLRREGGNWGEFRKLFQAVRDEFPDDAHASFVSAPSPTSTSDSSADDYPPLDGDGDGDGNGDGKEGKNDQGEGEPYPELLAMASSQLLDQHLNAFQALARIVSHSPSTTTLKRLASSELLHKIGRRLDSIKIASFRPGESAMLNLGCMMAGKMSEEPACWEGLADSGVLLSLMRLVGSEATVTFRDREARREAARSVANVLREGVGLKCVDSIDVKAWSKEVAAGGDAIVQQYAQEVADLLD